MKSQYCNKQELLSKILNGANLLAENVGSTLGPKGHNVLIGNRMGYENKKDKSKKETVLITKDGVTVSQYINSEDDFEQMAIDVVRQASEKTNESAGDGTTTTVVLSNAILQKAKKYIITETYHPYELKKGMEKAVDYLVRSLRKKASQVDSKELCESIAYISSNGDKNVARIVASAIEKVGVDGAITVEDSNNSLTKLEIMEGFSLPVGMLRPEFSNDEEMKVCKFIKPLVFVTDYKLNSLDDFFGVLEKAAQAEKSLVIVAEDFGEEALKTLLLNKLEGVLKICAIKAPKFGEERQGILEDLSIATGAKFFQKSLNHDLKEVDFEDLGQCEEFESTQRETLFVEPFGDGDKVTKRIEFLKKEIQKEKNLEEAKKLQQRIVKLASAIAVISVGAATEVEMKEKKHRFIDAIEAVVSAQQQGFIEGGGVALLRLSEELCNVETENETQKVGVSIIQEAIKEPFALLCKNSGKSFDVLRSKVLENEDFGFDFEKEVFCNLRERGVIDPVKVTINALENSLSAASILLTTNYSISIK